MQREHYRGVGSILGSFLCAISVAMLFPACHSSGLVRKATPDGSLPSDAGTGGTSGSGTSGATSGGTETDGATGTGYEYENDPDCNPTAHDPDTGIGSAR